MAPVSFPIHVSTTFDFSDPEFVYSRELHPTISKLEKALSKVCFDAKCVAYSSGLASIFAAFLFFQPKRIVVGKGYQGSSRTASLYADIAKISCIKFDYTEMTFQKGDLVWIETPINPTGDHVDLKRWVALVHQAGGIVVVDSTLAPPPLQNPFDYGVDMVMHSATKYFGGHSDLLAGLLLVPNENTAEKLRKQRTFMGNVLGSLEAWLLLRSLKTHSIRVLKQSESCSFVASWLLKCQKDSSSFVLPKDFPPPVAGVVTHIYYEKPCALLSFLVATPELARKLLKNIRLITPATSLGGVETLLDYRHLSFPDESPLLLRLSVGLEDPREICLDLYQAFIKFNKSKL